MIRVVMADDADAEPGRSQIVELPQYEASDAILHGKATLHDRQDDPPWILLDLIEREMTSIDRIGPPATGEVVARFVAEVLPNGIRQTVVGSRNLCWLHTSSRAEVAFRKQLIGPDGRAEGLVRQIGSALSYRLDRKQNVIFGVRPSENDVREAGIIQVSENDEAWSEPGWTCQVIGRQWFAFRERFIQLTRRLNELFVEGLRTGRVLIVEEHFPGGRLIHPDHWVHQDYDPTNHPNDHFIFTSALPPDWFETGGGAVPSTKGARKRGRPKGTGYFEQDAPHVKAIHEMLSGIPGATIHGVVQEYVQYHNAEISGASFDSKVRRLSDRVGKIHE